MSSELKTKEQWLMEGINHYKAKRYEVCLTACKRATQLDPQYVRAFHGMARSLASLHRYYEALVMYNKVIALEQNNSEIYKQRGDVHYELVDYVSASNDYYRAIVLNPKN